MSDEEMFVRTVGTQHAASASGLAEQKCHIFMCLWHSSWSILRADAACCVRYSEDKPILTHPRLRFCRAKIPLFMCLRHYYWNILRADAACCVPTAST